MPGQSLPSRSHATHGDEASIANDFDDLEGSPRLLQTIGPCDRVHRHAALACAAAPAQGPFVLIFNRENQRAPWFAPGVPVMSPTIALTEYYAASTSIINGLNAQPARVVSQGERFGPQCRGPAFACAV
jgi:hypothetical protein